MTTLAACRPRRGSVRPSGFTLLEVMVAVSILGLALTVILSSQAGLFSSASSATHVSVAIQLARCRMNEVELELLKNGYPLIDQSEEGPCCDEELDPTYSCEWKVERVELPEAGSLELGDGGVDTGLPTADPTSPGPFSALAQLQQPPGSAPMDGTDGTMPGFGDLAGMFGGPEGGSGIAGMLMAMVYPDLKPMLEASIRKVTVNVKWKEGSNERHFNVVQYVTDPMQGDLDEALRQQGFQDLEGLNNPMGQPSLPPATPGSSKEGVGVP